MRWIDFPAAAEFTDRHGVVRAIRGCTIFGRFEFSDRMRDIAEILDSYQGDCPWGQVYRDDARFRHNVERALACWGIEVEWLAASQIEELLLGRGDGRGWLLELSEDKTHPVASRHPSPEGNCLAEAIAAIATHCQTLTEAIDLAGTMPADLLVDVLKAKDRSQVPAAEIDRREKMDFLKANYNELMAKSHGDTP